MGSSAAYPSTPTAARGAAARRSSLAPTSLSSRSESRQQEDRKPSSLSRSVVGSLAANFQVGERVRITSMGLEGTLRFAGTIDGKNGTWAGVELSGNFSGRGKNDGSVDGCGISVV